MIRENRQLHRNNQNNYLKAEISKASYSQDFLEAYARENYGYIKKNEIFFQIIKDE